jgi:ATP-independent RNA helicase DbpA
MALTIGRCLLLQVLVLDEADCLLDMGFRPAIEAIMKHLPSPLPTIHN